MARNESAHHRLLRYQRETAPLPAVDGHEILTRSIEPSLASAGPFEAHAQRGRPAVSPATRLSAWVLAITLTTLTCPIEAMEFATVARESPATFHDASLERIPGAISGNVVAVPLNAKGNQGTMLFTCRLPGQLAPTAPGAYKIVLRVKLDPPDACSDYITLSYANAAQTFLGTDRPDPKDGTFRLWSMDVRTSAPDPATKPPTLSCLVQEHHFAGEPRFNRLLLDTISVTRLGKAVSIDTARVDKVLYGTKDLISFAIGVRNWTGSAATSELRVVESSDIDTETEIGRKPVQVAADSEASVVFNWNAGSTEYGRAVRAELLEDGKVADSATDYFNVSDNVWKVAIRAAGGPHMTDPDSVHCPYKTEDQWKKFLVDFPRQLHAAHGNFMEWFAWSPDDAFFMTPTQQRWISGQGAYQHDRQRIIDLNKVYRVSNDN